jgi:putative hydrolase of the HAD superfamily
MLVLPRFLLLDLDDTILNYTTAGDRCWENLCLSFAPRVGDLRSDELLSAINQTRRWFWSDPDRHRAGRLDLKSARRRIVLLAFERLRIDDCQTAEELADAFTTIREELVQPFPGALAALRGFQKQSIPMGLITNGNARFQRSKLQRFDLEQFFSSILIESEFGCGKPDKRVYLHTLKRLDASPADSWMIGDDLNLDIRPAQELGMAAVWIDHAKTGLPADSSIVPRWTVNSLVELINA